MMFLKKGFSFRFFLLVVQIGLLLCVFSGGVGAKMVCVFIDRVLSGVLSALSSHAIFIKLSPSST